MEIKENMCYSHLLAILMDTEGMGNCVQSVNFTAPDLKSEGFNGFMETHVVFRINPMKLKEYAEMYQKAFKSVTPEFYGITKRGELMQCLSSFKPGDE